MVFPCEQPSEKEHPSEVTWRQEITHELVKSAGRTLQILEYFSDVRRSATIGEISHALHYPHSSTAALLHTMTELGYMVMDRNTRRYRPSGSVALLGSWIDERLVRDGPMQTLMRAVAAHTQDMVLLAYRNGLYCKFVYAIQPQSLNRVCSNGSILPLVNVAAGRVLLSGLPDAEIRRIVMRSNAQAISTPHVNHVCFIEEVSLFRTQKYLIAPTMMDGFHQLVVGLPSDHGDPDLVLVVGGEQKNVSDSVPEWLDFLDAACVDILGYNPGLSAAGPTAESLMKVAAASGSLATSQRPLN